MSFLSDLFWVVDCGVKNQKNYFKPMFLPFQPIWYNFDLFHFWKISNPRVRGKKTFSPFWPFWNNFFVQQIWRRGGPKCWLHISCSWVNCSWHKEFQLPGRSIYYYSGRPGGWVVLEIWRIRLIQPAGARLSLTTTKWITF